MQRPRPNTLRRAAAWAQAVVLLTIAVFATQRTIVGQSEANRADVGAARAEQAGLVALWESLIIERIAAWTDELKTSENPSSRVATLRESARWLDAAYVWRGRQLEHPRASVAEDTAGLLALPCMAAAQSHAVVGERATAAEAFLSCEGPPEQTLLAAWTAANLYAQLGQPQDTLRALNHAPASARGTLAVGVAARLNLRRLWANRSLHLDALETLGRTQERDALLTQTIVDVSELDGGDLIWALAQLKRWSDTAQRAGVFEVAETRSRWQRTQRRGESHDTMAARVLSTSPTAGLPILGGELRVLQDRSGDAPKLLVLSAPSPDGRRVALQVDTASLLRSLLHTTEGGRDASQTHRAILDGENRAWLGDVPTEDVRQDPRQWVQVPFRQLVPHMSFGVTRDRSRAREQAISNLIAQLLPVLVALVIGMAAIAAQIAADRRQRDLLERQQAFVARVTHELKTPLAGIRLMAETIEMGAADDEAAFLQRIVAEVERLEERIDEVLTLGRGPDSQQPSGAKLQIEALAARVVDKWTPRFEAAGAELVQDWRACPPVLGDAALLEDALTNLLDNALKYQREGVRGRTRVRCGEMGRWVVLEVSDNGIGVPPNRRKDIFERFTRVEGPGRGKSGGHGLGLAFVAEAAAAHGGLVECVEGPDGGACFRLKLKRG